MEMNYVTPFMNRMERKREKNLSQLVCTAYPDGSWNRNRRYGEKRHALPGVRTTNYRVPGRGSF